ncbi:MAG: hypothetical protein ACERLG_11965, partial [Sedimentibacter sp.]
AKNTISIGTNFAILIKSPKCSEKSAKKAYEYIYKSRVKINTPVCFMDFYGDIERIDSIISDKSCFLSINGNGQVNFPSLCNKSTEYNILNSTIEEILSSAVD